MKNAVRTRPRVYRTFLYLFLQATLACFPLSSEAKDLLPEDSRLLPGTNTLPVPSEQDLLSVSGKVTDIPGQPLPGVSIVVKGTTTGTITGTDGTYHLTGVPDNATLIFSFVGMKTLEIVVNARSRIDISLEEETIGLEEIVAVGYGTMKRSSLTGSTAVMDTSVGGNPNLVGATANSYDLRLEYYPNSNGDFLGVGAFYKEITDPIERINNSNRVISYFTTISYNNAESATLKGLEIELRKSLNFIPLGFFRNLSVTSNASFISSNVVPNQELARDGNVKERPLQGQASLLINAGIYYENPGWGSKVGVIYNYAGENIYAAGRGYKANQFVGGAEFRGGLIELPRQLLDFSYTQRIGKGMQMKFAVQNLLDSKIEMAEDNNFTDNYEKYHEQPTEMEDGRMDYGDNIASRFKPGRYFSLSILYSF